MGCTIKYKGQSISEEQFLQYLNKQIAINNLFNENETLANAVYEALGFTENISDEQKQQQKADIERINKERDEYGLEPLRPTYRGTTLSEWENIQDGKIISSDNMQDTTWVSDKKEYSDEFVKNREDGILIEFKPEAIDKSVNESGQENDTTGVRLGRNLTINDIQRVTDSKGNVLYDAELAELNNQITPQQKQQAIQTYSQYLEQGGSQGDIQGFRNWINNRNNQKLNSDSLFGLNTQNQEQLEFHINTLNVVSQFLENIGIETRLIPEFLSQDGSVVEGAIAAANFIEGTVDIIDDLEKGRAEAWNKLPEEAAHWWYRLLDTNSPLKKALWESHKTALKNDELYKGKYGKLVSKPEDLTEESIGQLIAEAIKRIETKNANASDYSFFKKFLEWINSIINIFKNTTQDPFEVAAMKILSSDMSDLMTWEEYRKLNNIVNFADVLTEQSVAPIDYTLIEDLGKVEKINEVIGFTNDGKRITQEKFLWVGKNQRVNGGLQFGKTSPSFSTMEELDRWVSVNIKEHDIRQRQLAIEARDNQIFFDRLLNKTFRKRSKFLPKTLRKYFDIIDAQNLNPLREWNISQELQQITKKLSEQEKKQLIETNGYTNIAPTLKVLPDLLKKYRKNPIVLSEPIKVDGAKKQELSILNGIREMIKLENPNLKSITAEEFVNEAHNWLQTNYLLGFANEKSYLTYRINQTFNYAPDVYHNKVSLRFNDMYHLKSGHFDKSPSAWGNLTYFYTGKNKWKDAVLLHEIQNDNIEFLREFKAEKVDLETSLGRYLQQLNKDLLDNIAQIESGSKKIIRKIVDNDAFPGPRDLTTWLYFNKDLPLEQGLQQLKQRLNELIELHKSDTSRDINKAREAVIRAYSQRRKFQDFQKRGGIKSLLTEEELNNLKELLNRLNTEEVMTGAVYMPEENQYEPGYPVVRNLAQKKQDFKTQTQELQVKINNKLKELYGDDAPVITLEAPAKPLPKSLRNMRTVGFGANQRRIGGASQELNENVNFLIAYSEKQINTQLSKNIEESKKNYISARNATAAYNFNVALSRITPEQYATLVENYKYNEDLLNKLIDEQAQKDLKKESIDISKLTDAEIKKDIRNGVFSRFAYKDIELDALTIEEAVDKVRELYDKNKSIFKQRQKFEILKQKALEKKAELEENYGKIEEEVKQTLEIEMNYFTPLVHHLIQKHISQYGKDFPMYFSGYQITKLTQGSDRTALIYAGKDEINIVDKQDFEFNGKRYRRDVDGFDYLVQQHGTQNEITQQEYEKAYQQATERRAKEIKYEAAKQIGLLKNFDTSGGVNDKLLEEGIKKLNEYKRKSKQNMDRVINTIMNISNSKPIETGAIYNAMSQISGVKLIWQDKIEGLKGNTGGYLVDLSNYNYNTPILYGLKRDEVVPINPSLVDNSKIQYSRNSEETSQINLSPQSFPIDSNKVNYVLRTVNILSNLSDKQKQFWRQWQNNKLTNEQLADRLQIPKEQKPLFIEELDDRFLTPEQAIVNLSSKYSYTVEINTAKSTLYKSGYFAQESVYGEWSVYDAQGNTVEDGLTQGQAIRRAKQFNENDIINTQYYSDVTVNEEFYKNNPDWEYKEQRITTPLITPSIKGHAQFAQDNDIGWFRAWYNKKTGEVHVLEVQSDLFQRGRNKEDLTGTYSEYVEGVGEMVGLEEKPSNPTGNKFLQLLNKDNNWVTFFVKSIIQDSVRKGYKKVLFPSGDTASKIQGHQTLEEFKKQTEDRIKELEIDTKYTPETLKVGDTITQTDPFGGTIEVVIEDEKHLKSILSFYEPNIRELNQLKQELERVEREGFAALRPIYNFYENTITSILDKQGYNPVEITDEYGNTWNEISLENEEEIILLSPASEQKPDLNKMSKSEIFDMVVDNINQIPEMYRQPFLSDIDQSLREVSEQLNDPFTETPTRMMFGDTISDIALYLYPNALSDNMKFLDNYIENLPKGDC